ncbi:hypothetical protein V6Z12_A04G055300 [Gossypium hirsutum]
MIIITTFPLIFYAKGYSHILVSMSGFAPYTSILTKTKTLIKHAFIANCYFSALGKLGIICVKDLIHEIMIVGPQFKEANNFFWPFKLKAPLGGLKKKRNHYLDSYGNIIFRDMQS